MPGPALRSPYNFDLPAIESGKLYRPGSIARQILNLYVTADDALASVRGPTLYEHAAQQSPLGPIYGIAHCSTLGGANDVLVIRAGPTLYRHAGWNRTWEAIPVGLNNDVTNGTLNTEDRQPYPDAMLALNGLIVWSNGIDRPRVIDARSAYGSRMAYLGFARIPAAPTGLGPISTVSNASGDGAAGSKLNKNDPPNWSGYSHQGKIGTVGDEMVGEDGCLRTGTWFYFTQLEDDFGNRSPLSPPSGAVTVQSQNCGYDPPAINNTDYKRYNTTDDLTRQFLVKGIDQAPPSVAYALVYRTRDTRYNSSEPHLLVRIPGQGPICFPDNIPDGLLSGGPVPQDLITMPNFRICWEYQGRLAIANTSASPGTMWLTEPGPLGTVQRKHSVDPDPTGAEVTGGFSAFGKTYAMTARSLFAVSIGPAGLVSDPVSRTVGCVAPKSVVALPDGSVVWLGRDGFYRFDGTLPVRISDQIFPTCQRINLGRAGRAVAEFDARTGEYICAVPLDSNYGNDRLCVYDPDLGGWREQDHGIHYRAMTVTNDHRYYFLAAGGINNVHNVFLLDHESRTFTPPTKTYQFSTAELRLDPTGRRRGNVSTLYLGFIEAETPLTATITWYANGRRDSPVTQAIALVDVDLGTLQTWGTALLGTTPFRAPKLFWRKADIGITDCTSFRFDLSIQEPGHMTIVGMSFDASLTDKAGSRVPGAV